MAAWHEVVAMAAVQRTAGDGFAGSGGEGTRTRRASTGGLAGGDARMQLDYQACGARKAHLVHRVLGGTGQDQDGGFWQFICRTTWRRWRGWPLYPTDRDFSLLPATTSAWRPYLGRVPARPARLASPSCPSCLSCLAPALLRRDRPLRCGTGKAPSATPPSWPMAALPFKTTSSGRSLSLSVVVCVPVSSFLYPFLCPLPVSFPSSRSLVCHVSRSSRAPPAWLALHCRHSYPPSTVSCCFWQSSFPSWPPRM